MNTKAERAIKQLFETEDLIKESDFMGLNAEYDTGFRQRAIEHIKRAAEEIDAMMAKEERTHE